MSWQRVSIGSVSIVVTKGTTPTSIGFNFAKEGIPFLRVNNIQNGKLISDDILFIDSETDKALARSRIQPGDVLISIAGTIGRTAVVPPSTPAMNCNQAVAIVRLCEDIDPYYVNHWFNTDDAVKQITNSKVTATISNLSLGCIKELQIPLPPLEEQRLVQVRPEQRRVKPSYLLRLLLWQLAPERIGQLMRGSTSQHLNVKDLRAMPIPVPSLELQEQFSKLAIQTNALQEKMRKSEDEQEKNFNSLLQRAFRGEL